MKTVETYTYAHTRVFLPCLFLIIYSLPTFAQTNLSTAIQNTRNACSGISDSMYDMKVKAGINTAVTSVGTVAGGVALGTGIAKANVDKEIDLLLALDRAPAATERDSNSIELSSDDYNVLLTLNPDANKISELEQKSKTLGNVRTGTLAASTVTNIAGTAIAATNKVSDDLEENIQKCIESVKELSNAKLTAKMEKTATDAEIAFADQIINACRDYEYVDLKPINKRATGAAVSSGIGIGTGVIGTITSAVANTDKTRNGDIQTEKGLNTTANIMAGASTGASAVATIFNATQISAIKKVANVAEVCEGALK